MKKVILLILFLVIIPNVSCQKSQSSDVEINKNLKVVNLKVGQNAVFKTELAQTTEQRRIGLMNRKSMIDDGAMLFIFESDMLMHFWMKNTIIPLSIAYISKDGEILEIHNMIPQSLESVPSTHFARYALEVNLNAFEKYGVKVGDKIDLLVVPQSN